MATQTSKLTFLIVVLSFQFTSALHRNVCMSSVTVTKDDCRSAATKVCESEANPADPRAETVGNCVATFVNNNNATSPTFTDCMYRMDLILRLTSGASGGGGIHGGASGYDVNNAPTGEALYSILPNDVPGGCLREESLPYDPAGIPVPEGGGAPDPTQDTCSEEYIAPVQSLDGRQRANAWLCWLQGASLTLSLLCPNICYGAYFTLYDDAYPFTLPMLCLTCIYVQGAGALVCYTERRRATGSIGTGPGVSVTTGPGQCIDPSIVQSLPACFQPLLSETQQCTAQPP